MYSINLPTKIVFGERSAGLAPQELAAMEARRVFIVTGPGRTASSEALGELKSELEKVGLTYVHFAEAEADPSISTVAKGAALYKKEGCDSILAFGGGSPMDCAKGIGIVAAHGRSIIEFEGVDTIRVPSPPLILIPTTAGTSADVSQFVIISNQTERMKFSIVSKAVVPDVSLIDPETTVSMDPFLSACTGIDALVHAIEAFVSTGSGPLTDPHALEAMRLINGNLVQMIANPHDIALREKIMLGSMQAGLAFSNASLGAVHAMAHSLGGYKDLPHGECNALLLPHVIDFNFPAAPERFRVIAETMGLDARGMTTSEVRAWLLHSMMEMREAVGIREHLAARGIRVDDIPVLSGKAVLDPCLATNPKNANKRDIQVIYEEAT